MAYVPFQTIYFAEHPEIANAINQNFASIKITSDDISAGGLVSSSMSSVIKDSDTRITYSGATDWTVYTAGASAPAGYLGGYNNQYHSSNVTNAYFQYSASLGAINLYCITGPDCGKISVSLDGVATTIDLYSASYAVTNVYSSGTIQLQQHTIKVTVLGTKNASSTGFRCNFVCITDGTQLADANMLVGALNDVSIGSISANKLTAGSIAFNIGLNNGNGTFSVDKNGNVVMNSVTVTGGSININSGVFQVTNVGALTATSATITGTINASAGTISGNLNLSGQLQIPYTTKGIAFSSDGGSNGEFDFYTNGATLVNTLYIQGNTISGVGPGYAFGDATSPASASIRINGSTHASTLNIGAVSCTGLISGGSLSISGSKSCIVPTGDGIRRMYAVEAAQNYFEDFGEAQVVDGVIEVPIESLYQDTIEGQYHVFLTPYAWCDKYYVERKGSSFIIHASQDILFSWRITGNRKGYTGVRMEPFIS